MKKSRFSYTCDPADHPGTTTKENLDVLRDDGLTASVRHNTDGTTEYRMSGDEETVSKWKRLISG